ncbi:hypothetical protein [Phycicoccus flavus]|uniref:hypothetical protein n=1 Tax=Phycicoccus flavus TaxID=2502783 RepID=UPI000FEB9A70|nr:hypothetical protein [Phycicoccus flavus]NHA67008.1 hypothetical protein [Phycicoccus flavus]
MGLFGRRRREQPETGADRETDPELTFLTVAEAARFRAVVREVLAGMGREVELRPQSVVTDDGREWGLWNVAANAHGDERGPAGWPDVVREHFEKTFRVVDADLDALSDEEYLAALRMRLVDEQTTRALLGSFEHALPWADGVVRLPTLDLPESVATPSGEELRGRGDLARLLDRAWANTAALVATEDLEREHVEHEGHDIWCVLGDSFYTASLALVLPDLVRRFEPAADLSGGVVLAVPHRHLLAYRVLDSPGAALGALLLLPRFAAGAYADSPGPVSPHTYLWRDGEVTTLTSVEDGTLSVTPGPYLEELLSALSAEDDGAPS